ncbi:hypothetical protein JVU11DRAFT_2826 [Chiua virens]|nr:hypothetical protein JVU11DRAFT_2826 [Chiua virens]
MLFRQTTLQWLEHIQAFKHDKHENEDDEVLAVMDIPVTLAHGGSSFGNLDPILPLEYPLPPTHPLSPFSFIPHPSKVGYIAPPLSSFPSSTPITSADSGTDCAPKIVIQDIKVYLHTRPAELYLGAWSTGGQLHFYSFYDSNVFEEAVVKEWMDEIKGAVSWYLGRPHAKSLRGRKSHAAVKGGQAKL